MSNANRRSFIKTAGVGAAAAGVVALVPTGTSVAGAAAVATHPVADTNASLPSAAKGSMVAYIHDVSTGEVSVMVEGREVTVTDHQLVAKIAQAMHSNSKA